jgi:hypothetical protein
MRTIYTRFGAIALGAIVAGACSKKEDQVAADTTSTAPAAAPAPAQSLTIVGVELGKAIGPDKRVTQAMTTFAAKDTIYAAIATEGAPASATLTAKWATSSGEVVDSTAQTIMPTGPAVTEFHISKPGGLRTGKYMVTIYSDGVVAKTIDFDVK